MGKRRKSRELALQLLYQLDVQDERSPGPYLDEFWGRHPVDMEVRAFVESLVRGTKLHQQKIDEMIAQYAENWDLDRMAVVDRNILREGIFELLWMIEIRPRWPSTRPSRWRRSSARENRAGSSTACWTES